MVPQNPIYSLATSHIIHKIISEFLNSEVIKDHHQIPLSKTNLNIVKDLVCRLFPSKLE